MARFFREGTRWVGREDILFTRGASGMGRAISLKLARDRANVVGGDILKKEADEICRQIVECLGKNSLTISADVPSSKGVALNDK